MPFVQRDRVAIHYETFGDREAPGGPMLFVPGLSANTRAFPRLFEALTEQYHVIALDPRGAGRSAPRLQRFRLSDVAHDALAVLDAVGVDRAHVLGLSMGGMIAQELALAAPSRIRRLVLCCTTCGTRPGVRARPAVIGRLVRGLGRVRGGADAGRIADAMGDVLFAPETERSRRVQFFTPRIEAAPPSRGGVASQLLAVRAFGSFGRLHRLRTPTLVIHGDRDVLVPTVNAAILADAIPDSRLEILPGGHVFFYERHDEFVRRVRSFLDEGEPSYGVR